MPSRLEMKKFMAEQVGAPYAEAAKAVSGRAGYAKCVVKRGDKIMIDASCYRGVAEAAKLSESYRAQWTY